jgi:hypothetical protein
MVREVLADLDTDHAFRSEVAGDEAPNLALPDGEALKQRAGLKVPSAATPLGFSARIRTEAVARLGFYTVVEWTRRVVKKPAATPTDKGLQALLDGLRRIKRETVRAVEFHFKNYRENIKFQYLFKLIEAAAASIEEVLSDQLRAYGEDLSQLAEKIESTGAGRQQVAAALEGLAAEASAASRALGDLHGRLARMLEEERGGG